MFSNVNPCFTVLRNDDTRGAASGFGDTILTSKIAPGDIAGLLSKPYRLEQLREVLREVVDGYAETTELN